MIELSNLSAWYGSQKILENINLDIHKGEFLALFGDDDAGKTTLLNTIMGFHTEYKGTVHVFERDLNSPDAQVRSQIRFVPDDIIWDKGMTAADYFQFAESISHDYDSQLQEQLCEKFSIPLQTLLLDMTYQENKMVQIAAAICAQPKLLILDEPFNFLGKATGRELLKLLSGLHAGGMSILVAAEHYEELRGYCDHYAYIREGTLTAVAEVPKPDIRNKIVTVANCTDLLKNEMSACIAEYRDRSVFLYKGNMQRLADILLKSGCIDWSVEELTLQEELDENYERWQ